MGKIYKNGIPYSGTGQSPKVVIKENTNDSYKLQFIDNTGTIETPNLKGEDFTAIQLTKAEYDALSQEKKEQGIYWVTDEIGGIEIINDITTLLNSNGQGAAGAQVVKDIYNKMDSDIPFRFGIDENGNYGYYKAGADSVTPFKFNKGNAVSSVVLEGYDYSNATGYGEGSMPNYSNMNDFAISQELAQDDKELYLKATVPYSGYYKNNESVLKVSNYNTNKIQNYMDTGINPTDMPYSVYMTFTSTGESRLTVDFHDGTDPTVHTTNWWTVSATEQFEYEVHQISPTMGFVHYWKLILNNANPQLRYRTVQYIRRYDINPVTKGIVISGTSQVSYTTANESTSTCYPKTTFLRSLDNPYSFMFVYTSASRTSATRPDITRYWLNTITFAPQTTANIGKATAQDIGNNIDYKFYFDNKLGYVGRLSATNTTANGNAFFTYSNTIFNQTLYAKVNDVDSQRTPLCLVSKINDTEFLGKTHDGEYAVYSYSAALGLWTRVSDAYQLNPKRDHLGAPVYYEARTIIKDELGYDFDNQDTSFFGCSDATFKQILQYYNEGKINIRDYWHIGDERYITLETKADNGQIYRNQVLVRLVHINDPAYVHNSTIVTYPLVLEWVGKLNTIDFQKVTISDTESRLEASIYTCGDTERQLVSTTTFDNNITNTKGVSYLDIIEYSALHSGYDKNQTRIVDDIFNDYTCRPMEVNDIGFRSFDWLTVHPQFEYYSNNRILSATSSERRSYDKYLNADLFGLLKSKSPIQAQLSNFYGNEWVFTGLNFIPDKTLNVPMVFMIK